jgi:hypothetical protein
VRSVEGQVRGPLAANPAEGLPPLERLNKEVDVAGCLRIETSQPDRMHLEFGRQQIADLAGLLIATLGEVLHVFSPLRDSRPATRAAPPKVTVSAIQPLIIGRRTAKINEEPGSVSARLYDQLVHPWRDHHVHRHTIRSRHQEKVASFCCLQVVDLSVGQVERLLQLDGFGMLL